MITLSQSNSRTGTKGVFMPSRNYRKLLDDKLKIMHFYGHTINAKMNLCNLNNQQTEPQYNSNFANALFIIFSMKLDPCYIGLFWLFSD